MPIYSFEGRKPVVSRSAYVHPTAVVTGKVTIGEDCYIGPGACLRGDWGEIVVEDGSNVQENVVVHARPESVTRLGPESHIGHGAILHGCTLGEHVFVGMGAVINDGAVLEDGSVIASGAVVTPGTRVPRRMLMVGVPARAAREVPDEMAGFNMLGTRLYQTLPARYSDSLEELDIEDCRTDPG